MYSCCEGRRRLSAVLRLVHVTLIIEQCSGSIQDMQPIIKSSQLGAVPNSAQVGTMSSTSVSGHWSKAGLPNLVTHDFPNLVARLAGFAD
jgi:hypothetical protein